jgi:hypothetical protein
VQVDADEFQVADVAGGIGAGGVANPGGVGGDDVLEPEGVCSLRT